MVPELHEGADMALADGVSSESRIETAPEVDCSTVANQMEEILHFSESPSPAGAENAKDKESCVANEVDAENAKDKESLVAKQVETENANGQESLVAKQLEAEGQSVFQYKSRNNNTLRVSRPPALVIPRLGESNNNTLRISCPPATLMSSPSKPLDPNAPEFTPSPRLYPSFSPAVSPVGIPGPYMVGSTVEFPYGYPSPRPRPSGLAPQTPTDQVSRSLLLSQVAVELEEETLKEELSAWGDIRCIEFGKRSEGIVIIHYYDIRNSAKAFQDIFHQYRKSHQGDQSATPTKGLIGGKAVCVRYTQPTNCSEHNQGTLFVSNLDADISLEDLRATFENYGCVKDVRGSPSRSHMFVEFYDTRDAERAMAALGGKEIYGKRARIDFCRTPKGRTNSIINGSIMGGTRSPWNPHEHQQGPPSPFDLILGAHPQYGQVAQLQSNGIPSFYGGYNGQISQLYMPCSPSNEFQSAMNLHNFNSSSGLTPRSTLCAHYIFNEKEVEVNQGTPRTTLMVRNIPNKYSLLDFITLLDEHCLQENCRIMDSDNEVESAYDFVYLPIDFKNRCNLGYGFVNFTSVEATVRFYKDRHNKMWERFNSNKVCEISYARLQGLAVLKEHFQNSVFPCSTDKFLPATFNPPRDGIQCTPPTFAAGHLNGGCSNNSNISSSPKNCDDTSIFSNGHLNGGCSNNSNISSSPRNGDDTSIFSNGGNNKIAGSCDDHKVIANQTLETSAR